MDSEFECSVFEPWLYYSGDSIPENLNIGNIWLDILRSGSQMFVFEVWSLDHLNNCTTRIQMVCQIWTI